MKMLTAVAALLLAGTAHAGVINYFTAFEPEGGGLRRGGFFHDPGQVPAGIDGNEGKRQNPLRRLRLRHRVRP